MFMATWFGPWEGFAHDACQNQNSQYPSQGMSELKDMKKTSKTRKRPPAPFSGGKCTLHPKKQ